MGEARQYLRHGKALCGKIFPLFVDTFNWLVDFGSNIKGDDDATRGNGHIILDRSDPHHPVIRCKGCEQSSSPAPSTDQAPSPFQYTEAGTIENCRFYWDGVEQTLQDYTPSATCTVYLVCTLSSAATANPSWSFSIAESAGAAPSGGRVVNYKLYTFVDGLVTMDYRTTFMELKSPHDVAYFKVSPPSASQNITLDATTSSPEVSVTNGSKEIELKPSELSRGNKASVHTLTLKNIDGTTLSQYDVISNDDIEVRVAPVMTEVDVVTGFSLQYNGGKIQAKYQKARVKAVVVTTSESTWNDVMTLEEVDVSTEPDYSTNTHKFTHIPRTLYVPGADSAGNSEEVFESTPHTSE